MQALPHGLPLTQCGFLVSAPLRHELINCLRASPLMPLACALQSFIFCCCGVSCAWTDGISAINITTATTYFLMSGSLLEKCGRSTLIYPPTRAVSIFNAAFLVVDCRSRGIRSHLGEARDPRQDRRARTADGGRRDPGAPPGAIAKGVS